MKGEIIVVGGGIAGLTAALTIVQKGEHVLLLEKNELCGGLMNSFEHEGFRFEGGARAMVNAGLVQPLIKDFNLEIEILPNPISLGIEDKRLVIQGERSLYDYAEMLKGLYPESVQDVDQIILAIRRIIDDMSVLYGADNPLFTEKRKNFVVLLPSFLAWTYKLIRTLYRISRMNTPFEAYLDSISSNQSLKDIIGQHFFKRTPVFFALSYFALYNDYIYPKGGVGALMQKLEDAIQERGGEVRHNTEVVSVDAGNKTLTDSTGQRYQYDKMIWAGDLKSLYAITDDTGLSGKVKTQFLKAKNTTLRQKGAESVFSVFLAVDQAPENFGNIATGHVFYTPDRSGLGKIHSSELKNMLQKWDTIQKEEVFAWLRRFCRQNTYEISIPVLRDPDAAPVGKTGIIISVLFDYELTDKIRSAGWYEEFKRYLENEIITTISTSLYTGLREHLLFSFSSTPLSIYSKVKSSEGSIVGWSFEGEIPVPTSMFRMGDSVRTALPDVYAAGKWVYSPAGGPTAIMTGRIAAARCLKKR